VIKGGRRLDMKAGGTNSGIMMGKVLVKGHGTGMASAQEFGIVVLE
jgi:hypothetical protein